MGSLSYFDLQHGYWAIPLHPDDRHMLTFDPPGFCQLQPTRMPEGSSTSGFTFTELMKITLGTDSLPHQPLAPPTFYMNDIFATYVSFEGQWPFVREHLLPRLHWAIMMLRLSFKKVKIGFEGCWSRPQDRGENCYKAGASITNWPVPVDKTGVRGIHGNLGPHMEMGVKFRRNSSPLGIVPWR